MTSSPKIFLLRHGERLDYVDLLWQRKLKGSASDDPPLAPKGRIQAEQAAKRLAGENISFIVCSPFQRCAETASIVANVINKPIFIEPGLCEILWTFPPGYKSPIELKESFSRIDTSYCPLWSPEKGERFDTDCYARVSTCVAGALDKYPGSSPLFVSHRATIAGIFKHLVGRAYFVGLCTLSQLEQVGGTWRVLVAGDSSHLSDTTDLRAY